MIFSLETVAKSCYPIIIDEIYSGSPAIPNFTLLSGYYFLSRVMLTKTSNKLVVITIILLPGS